MTLIMAEGGEEGEMGKKRKSRVAEEGNVSKRRKHRLGKGERERDRATELANPSKVLPALPFSTPSLSLSLSLLVVLAARLICNL